jgi:hypothetical protein
VGARTLLYDNLKGTRLAELRCGDGAFAFAGDDLFYLLLIGHHGSRYEVRRHSPLRDVALATIDCGGIEDFAVSGQHWAVAAVKGVFYD